MFKTAKTGDSQAIITEYHPERITLPPQKEGVFTREEGQYVRWV